MKQHPWIGKNAVLFDEERMSEKKAREIMEEKRPPTKLLSGTGNTSVAVTPDGISIVFQSVKHGHTIYWPASNWLELRNWLDSSIRE